MYNIFWINFKFNINNNFYNLNNIYKISLIYNPRMVFIANWSVSEDGMLYFICYLGTGRKTCGLK